MEYVSRELALILNLSNTAIDHRKHCSENCNVSLYQLKLTAEYIYSFVPQAEKIEAKSYIDRMPLS